ncbi:MAG TPA: arylesterase [Vicinamibacterales bacterium]|jgi:acyl-CoA thioesterase-1|nr:arylesterase [Vicinamibacterales bacterium]
MRLNRWIAVLVLALAACGSASPTQPANSETPVVVALGDSLTAGPGLRDEEAYPALLRQRIRAAGLPHEVVNAGVSGDTTADALARLDRVLVPRTAVLIVALGANDGLRGVPVADVTANLTAILERARDRNLHVLLCGMETPPTRGLQYSIDFHNVYPALADRFDVPLMPFLLTGVVGRPELNLADGFHPNAAGMRIIAENLWPYLEPLLR